MPRRSVPPPEFIGPPDLNRRVSPPPPPPVCHPCKPLQRVRPAPQLIALLHNFKQELKSAAECCGKYGKERDSYAESDRLFGLILELVKD